MSILVNLTEPPLCQAALAYVARGPYVLPLEPGDKLPINGPDGRLGWEDASDNPEQVAEWWDEDPLRNIGLACVGDLMVLDNDGET